MSEIVNSMHFGYRSDGDFMRHAVKEHFDWLVSIAPIKSFMQQIEAVNAIVVEEEIQLDFLKSMEKFAQVVLEHMHKGREDMAVSLIRRVKATVDTMPDDSDYKRLYLKDIEARWGALLRTSTAAVGGGPVGFDIMGDDVG